MKSFNKILSLVLTLTMLVSMCAMPVAFAAGLYPVGDTSDYEVAATFVAADGTTEVTEVEAGATVYLRLDLKKFSTLNSGVVTVDLEGATFVAETNKLTGSIFTKDTDEMLKFVAGSTSADYGILTDVANLTSKNYKVNYYAFAEPTDMYLAFYEVKVDEDATAVTATVSHELYVGDSNSKLKNSPVIGDLVITNDSLTVTGGEPPVVDPVITYSYSAKWNDVATAAKVFPEGTDEEAVKDAVVVTKVTTTDGVADGGVVMTEGYTVALSDGNVTVTIDADPTAAVAGSLTYTIEVHVPAITYSYEAKWSDVATSENVFPEGTEEDAIKEMVVVRRTAFADGVETNIDTMEDGFTVVLSDGNVTVTIDADPAATVTGNLTYIIEEHVPVVSYRYEATWKAENAFDYGTSEAAILSKVEVKKYTTTDGVEDAGEVITEGISATAADGVVTITIDGVDPIILNYTIIDKVEYKNPTAVAATEYDYVDFVDNMAGIEEGVVVAVEKWVNDAKDSDVDLVNGEDFRATATLKDNENAGSISIEFLGEYADLSVEDIEFTLTNAPITFENVEACLTQTQFHESVDEATVKAALKITADKVEGRLPAVVGISLPEVCYEVTVDLVAKKVTVAYVGTVDIESSELEFELIPAVITYKNAAASLTNDVFGTVPEAADIIARLEVKAEMFKDNVYEDVVEITSENYDVEIGDGVATITFKNAYAELEAVEVEFSVQEVTYGDPVIVVDGTITGNGKSNEEIIAEAWTLITATREVLTNGVVTGTEDLDKEALEELGVAASFEEGKLVFTFDGAVIAEVSVSSGMLQFASANPRTAHDEFIKFVGATLKDIFDNIKVKKDIFQIIQLNADEWETITEAITNGDATVTVDSVTYDSTNLNAADSVVIGDAESKVFEIAYKDVVDTVEVDLLTVATDYANEDNEAPVVSITIDATEVQIGTDVTATVYVKDLVGNIETGMISILYSNAEVDEADIVAADGFEILSKTIMGNEIQVVFTINDAAYDAGAGIFTVKFDTTNSDVNAKLGLAINDYELTRIVDMGDYNEYKPVNATIGDNVEVTVTAGDVLGYNYEVSYASGKTEFYTDADAVADVKVLAYTTTNGVVDPGQTPVDVTADCDINANNGVITVDKAGVRITTLTYSIYEASFEQFVAIETIGSVEDAKFVDNTSVKLNEVDVADATIALDGRSIKVAVAGIKAEGTYVIEVAVPGYTKAKFEVVVSKKPTLDGYNAAVVTGSKIYAGDINGDNRIDGVDFSDVAGKYSFTKEAKYDLYTGNDSDVIDNLDVTTMAHYFITLARGQVSPDGTVIIPYSGN
ncbi:MAG: hypothetical protein E7396_00420 [Ruminococcaceae bacterium]|nr:hypothetical protein [Oscillospiraceae bacterium]